MKITLGAETFEFDGSKKPMSEALAVEKAWGRRYAEFETELTAGSAEAFCVLAWLIWRRDGRDVKLADILDGSVDFDFAEFVGSFAEAARAEEEAAKDPTGGAVTGTAPDGTVTTPGATRRSSPRSTTSRRGTSES